MSLVKEPIAGVVYPSREDVNEYDRLGIFTDETMAEAFRALADGFRIARLYATALRA
ncbi:hypothetical protein [uncultured Roseibium sp.]|uniref:hypothetical protein n=1 Tax=uncultured Roseibium sp. TaxID=1936171 RepID=UPI0032179681